MAWPEPTTGEPTTETLAQWTDEGRGQATDGCWLVLGLMPDIPDIKGE